MLIFITNKVPSGTLNQHVYEYRILATNTKITKVKNLGPQYYNDYWYLEQGGVQDHIRSSQRGEDFWEQPREESAFSSILFYRRKVYHSNILYTVDEMRTFSSKEIRWYRVTVNGEIPSDHIHPEWVGTKVDPNKYSDHSLYRNGWPQT